MTKSPQNTLFTIITIILLYVVRCKTIVILGITYLQQGYLPELMFSVVRCAILLGATSLLAYGLRKGRWFSRIVIPAIHILMLYFILQEASYGYHYWLMVAGYCGLIILPMISTNHAPRKSS